MDVLLIHGYNVTSTKTYGVLPRRLKRAGHTIKDVYLGKYVTLDNDITLPDLTKAFQSALKDLYGPKLKSAKFACITHSTGGLVLRGWITAHHQNKMSACPVSHLIMLAPPNHGSRLSSLGKSRLSRLRSLAGVEPGLKILDALDLGSGFQWKVNSSWLENQTHSASHFYPLVITGQWIDKKVWDVIVPATYERGSDGVVRAASANVNLKKFSTFPDGKIKEATMEGTGYLITPRTSHADEDGIMGSIPEKGDHPVLTAILKTLAVRSRAHYKAVVKDFKAQTEAVQQIEKYYDGSKLDRYSQLVLRITDNAGNNITDYAVELLDYERMSHRFPTGFMGGSARCASSPHHFVFYLNYDQISQVVGGRVGFRVQSVPQSPLVAYEDFYFEGPASEVSNFLTPNQTTYVDVVLKRKLNKKVFHLTPNLSYQKIDRHPGPDWIE